MTDRSRGPGGQPTNAPARVAVIDDERRMVDILSMVLRRDGHRVTGYTDPDVFLARRQEDGPFDAVLTDLKMPGTDGLALMRAVLADTPETPVVLMTAFATVQTAVGAMKDGAFDYIQKPFDNATMRAAVQRALDLTRLSRENRYLRAELASRYAPSGIIAHSEPMLNVLALVRRVAASPVTVLVSGESGTGKELVARAVHYHSDRVGGPFVAVNARAFAEGVLESELFGHEKGAFTGAQSAREGVFERANGGTVFLDEIGDVNEAFQAKLLRVLQEREVQRVGGDAPRPVDVRLITATNKDLKAEIAAGRFREDLYFRLAVIPVHLPPLRDRPGDVMPLANHFLARANTRMGRSLKGFSPAVCAHLERYAWPGNVRELENTVERGAVLATGHQIELADLLLGDSPENVNALRGTLQEYLDHAAATRIRAVLQETGDARAEAADKLGIDRTTLYRWIKRLGL
jgi:DNA-binding NtrC family response regulator